MASGSPNCDLSRHFKHYSILAAAGISVKGVLPEHTECPLCKHDGLDIVPDPATPGAQWFYCRCCNFSGDTVELYGRINALDDFHQIVSKAIHDGVCTLNPADVRVDVIDDYAATFPLRRRKWALVWQSLRDNAAKGHPSPECLSLLQKKKLWSGATPASREAVFKYIGVGVPSDINKHFLKPEVPTSFGPFVALAYQDAPGRLCGLRLINEKGAELLKTIATTPSAGSPRKEGGLFMLENIYAADTSVVAIDDAWIVAHMQRKWLQGSSEPLKVVSYSDTTERTWQALFNKTVTLWARTIDWKIFNHARNLPNAMIAVNPTTEISPYDFVTYHGSPKVLLYKMQQSAKPWRQVFAEYITGRSLPDYRARETVAKLAFDTTERDRLVAECPRELRSRLEGVLGELATVKSATVRNTFMVEQDDGWWSKRRSGPERVCDAIIRVLYEIGDIKTGEVTWSGIVRFKNQDIPFREAYEVINKDPGKWLTKVTVGAGLGMPYVAPQWSNYIACMAKLFSSPKAVSSIAGAGIQSNGEIWFPAFKIVEGKIIPEDVNLQPRNAPAFSVTVPVEREKDPANDTEFRTRSIYINLVAAYVSNMLAGMRGERVRPIVVTGDCASAGYVAAKHLARTAGMQTLSLSASTPQEVASVRETLKSYHYPCFVETLSSNILENWPDSPADYVITIADPITAASLATRNPWIIVYGHFPCDKGLTLPPFDDVLMYLRSLQMRNYTTQDNVSGPQASLFDFCDWYCRYLRRPLPTMERTYPEAKRLLRDPLMAGDALLETVFWLFKAGALSIQHSDLSQAVQGSAFTVLSAQYMIHLDEVTGAVLIPKVPVIGAIADSKIARPDFLKATEDFRERQLLVNDKCLNGGWLLKKEYWDRTLNAWTQAQS